MVDFNCQFNLHFSKIKSTPVPTPGCTASLIRGVELCNNDRFYIQGVFAPSHCSIELWSGRGHSLLEVFFPILHSHFCFFLKWYPYWYSTQKGGTLPDYVTTPKVYVMATNLNYFYFVSGKSCFVWHFGIIWADDWSRRVSCRSKSVRKN